jgi:hypothetical protein
MLSLIIKKSPKCIDETALATLYAATIKTLEAVQTGIHAMDFRVEIHDVQAR